METPESREEDERIRGHRRTLLDGLRYHGGSANTSELRTYGDVPPGSIRHHLSVLEEWELIVQEGTERLDNGETAYKYHLTDAGSAAAEEIAESATTAETVESLEQKVNQQQEQLETLHDEVKLLREEVDELNELRAEFNRMAEIVEDLARQEQ
ncbi:hypothetical protein V5735_19465 [Haladaptatus sp. SPP-AMP-3]|uniref:hypothetical protein n=1 Tax=Haladaptatus sp. SPP-AMP-3 TaxID=3121295 RepID=UPI003C2B69EF